MYAADNSEAYRFRRGEEIEKLTEPEMLAQWERVLIGDARRQFFAKIMPSKAVFESIARMNKAANVLQKAAGKGKPDAAN